MPVLDAGTEQDLDKAFTSLGKIGADGLVVPAEPFFDSQRDRIVALAARYAVPMMSNLREYVVAGGLMSYGASLPDSYRRAGIYVGRVLKGENPVDLPVMQPTTAPPHLMGLSWLDRESPTVRPTGRLGSRGRGNGPKDAPARVCGAWRGHRLAGSLLGRTGHDGVAGMR